jgi:hypothetical protein
MLTRARNTWELLVLLPEDAAQRQKQLEYRIAEQTAFPLVEHRINQRRRPHTVGTRELHCKLRCASGHQARVAPLASCHFDQVQIVPNFGSGQNAYVSLAAQPNRLD